MEKPVLREYYVIDFYALYLVIRMPASWHVFADPVTITGCVYETMYCTGYVKLLDLHKSKQDNTTSV